MCVSVCRYVRVCVIIHRHSVVTAGMCVCLSAGEVSARARARVCVVCAVCVCECVRACVRLCVCLCLCAQCMLSPPLSLSLSLSPSHTALFPVASSKSPDSPVIHSRWLCKILPVSQEKNTAGK